MLTLRIYIKRSPLLDNGRLLDLFKQISDFVIDKLGDADGPPLINPFNMIVDEEGRLLDIDIGEESQNPHYIAPEVIRGESGDFSSLIYNLGAVLYFMATKKDPFGVYHEGTPSDAHFERALIEPHKINQNISPEMSAFIRKMLSFSKALRHKGVAAFNFDMKSVRRGEWPLNAPVSLDVNDNKYRPGHAKGSAARRGAESGRSRKRVAISKDKMADVQRSRRVAQRRPRNGFVYLALIVAAFWATWYFNIDQHLGNFDSVKSLVEKLKAVNTTVQSSPNPTSPSYERYDNKMPTKATATPVHQQQSAEDKYRIQRERYLEKLENSQRTSGRRRGKTWPDRDFLAGARLYNDAVDRIDRYSESIQNGRPDQRALIGVEDKIQSAVAYFKSCRDRAPEDVPIDKYIDNCYKLIAKTRQAKLLNLSR